MVSQESLTSCDVSGGRPKAYGLPGSARNGMYHMSVIQTGNAWSESASAVPRAGSRGLPHLWTWLWKKAQHWVSCSGWVPGFVFHVERDQHTVGVQGAVLLMLRRTAPSSPRRSIETQPPATPGGVGWACERHVSRETPALHSPLPRALLGHGAQPALGTPHALLHVKPAGGSNC